MRSATTLFSVGSPGVQLCSAGCPCTMYASFEAFNSLSPAGHVFRSTDSGQHWTNVGAALPDVPASSVAIDPQCPNVIYLATDMGVYQGTLNDGRCQTPNTGAWTWCSYMNGFPKTAIVKTLATHPESGTLRAYTFGRSAWDVPAFASSLPDMPVNTVSPVTVTVGPRISSGTTGQQYSIAWADDRNGLYNWHVYLRGFKYTPQGNPTALGSDFRVDDTTTHVAQAPSVAAYLTDDTSVSPYCSRVTWQDDRADQVTHVNHVYFQIACSDGTKAYLNDVLADRAAANVNALSPAIANQAITGQVVPDFAIAWSQNRSAGSSFHDIYAGFFNWIGVSKGTPAPVNLSFLDATNASAAADPNGNVFVAWEEYDSSPSKLTRNVFVRKYNAAGTAQTGVVQVNVLPTPMPTPPAPVPQARNISIAVDNNGQVTATWWEAASDGSQTEKVLFRRFTNALAPLGSGPVQVDQPPSAPLGVDRALYPTVATDPSAKVLVSWIGNVNAADSSTQSGFAHSFSNAGVSLKADFRVDLAGRANVATLRLARSSQPKSFAATWRDSRSGHFDVYTRRVPGVP